MKSEALPQRLFGETIGALDLFSIYLGDQLGYYRAMKSGDWVTADSLATLTETAPRYAEEWLSQQAVRQLVEVQDEQAEPRRYRLPADHVRRSVRGGSAPRTRHASRPGRRASRGRRSTRRTSSWTTTTPSPTCSRSAAGHSSAP
jgi:winged helix-turn-helix protein